MMRYILRSETQREGVMRYIERLRIQTPPTADHPLMEVVVRKYRKPKSLEQGGYLWAAVYPAIAQHICDSVGEVVSPETLHDDMKERFLIPFIRQGTDGMRREDRFYTTKGMDRGAMARFLDQILAYAAEYLGCYVPPPVRRGEDDA